MQMVLMKYQALLSLKNAKKKILSFAAVMFSTLRVKSLIQYHKLLL